MGDVINVQNKNEMRKLNDGVWWRHSISGALAGAISCTCTAPADRIKLFMQVQTKKTVYDSVRYMMRYGGIRSMWRGNGVNTTKISSDSAITFTMYEKVKQYIISERNIKGQEMSIADRILAGSIAGVISQTTVYPLDVLKTRLALQISTENKGLINLIKNIYAKEGIRSFYNGYTVNLLGVIPYAAIDLAFYETLKKYLNSGRVEQHPSNTNLLFCGAISSVMGQIITYPCSLIRTQLQARTPISRNKAFQIAKSIIVNEGFAGLYRGLFLNLSKVVPAVCLSYLVYEYSIRTLGVAMS